MTAPNTGCQPTQTPTDIDIDALRAKYKHEREKRLRKEGSKQYVEMKDEFEDFYDVDPHTPVVPRDPIVEDIDVAVLGGGFAGLLSAAQLKQAGVDDVRIIEKGGDFGGVWYWNRYPGIQCDNESYCYVPLLEELNFIPSKKFADGAEIFEHCRRIGKHYGLYDGAIFSTQVTGLRWDEDLKRWRIGTDRGDDIRARFVVMASGGFHRPKLPGIPGIKDFTGHSFHTSRWDYEYTGGDSGGGLDKLADKRVAVVGTGASGIQVIPFLGEYAKHLYVFQRTPSTVDRAQQHGDRSAVGVLAGSPVGRRSGSATSTPGPSRGWRRASPTTSATSGPNSAATRRAGCSRLDDPASLTPEEFMSIREEENYKLMERLRRHVDSLVDDPETAEALKPYYHFLCKRPCSNDDYLPTFNRPNVTLVDVSESKGVERATEKGLVANGVEYEVDCIIYASGFEITTDISRRYSIDAIEGRDGASLFDSWREGFKTFHGLTSRGFPNQFYTGFTQVGISANICANYELQGEHIAYVISEALARGVTTVEPSQEAQDEWCRTVKETFVDNSAFDAECTPGYYNNEGGGGGVAEGEGIKSHLGEPYGPGFYAFGDLLKAWRDKGDLDGLVLGT